MNILISVEIDVCCFFFFYEKRRAHARNIYDLALTFKTSNQFCGLLLLRARSLMVALYLGKIYVYQPYNRIYQYSKATLSPTIDQKQQHKL